MSQRVRQRQDRASAQTSSMTSTLDRFKMALAMQSNCFSLEMVRKCRELVKEGTYPVEKFSPPSDTGASRSRNTLALTVSSGVS